MYVLADGASGGEWWGTMPDEELNGGSPADVADTPVQGVEAASGVDTAVIDEGEIPTADELREVMGLPKDPLAEDPNLVTPKPGEEKETAKGVLLASRTKDEETDTARPEEEKETAKAREDEEPDTAKPEGEEVQKRINELTARAKTAEEGLRQAQADLAEAKSRAESGAKPDRQDEAAPGRGPDLFGLDAEGLAEVQRCERVRDWALANPDGGELPGPDGQPEFISPARAGAALAEAQATIAAIRVHSRERWQQAKAATDDYVKQVYPALADAKSEDAQAMARTLKALPELGRVPDAKVWIGRMLRGFRAEQEELKQRQAAAATPAAKPRVVPVAPAAGVVPRAATSRTQPTTSRRDERLAELRRRAQGGDPAAMEEYFAVTAD